MRAVIAVKGRFHAFDLAREVAREGALARLITSYPKGVAARFGVPTDRVRSHLALELRARLLHRLGPRALARCGGETALARSFGRFAARNLPAEADVFVGWSGVSLEALSVARARGYRTVLERGSTHILEQTEILAAESERLGVPLERAEAGLVARELEEYSLADAIAVPSLHALESFVARGVPREKLLHLPYGVRLDQFRPAAALPTGLQVLHCGSISFQKGCHHLLEAFAGLPDRMAGLTFLGRVHPLFAPRLARREDARVRVLGHRPQAELPAHYRRASVFCLASLQEGLAMVVLQAMASGLPIVATTTSGAGDLLTDGVEGFLVAPGDVDALRERLVTLAADPALRARMGRAARARAADGLDWRDYGRRALAAWESFRAPPIAEPVP